MRGLAVGMAAVAIAAITSASPLAAQGVRVGVGGGPTFVLEDGGGTDFHVLGTLAFLLGEDLPVSFRLDGAYQGKVFTNAENTHWAKIPGRLVSNAHVTWANEDGWKLGLEVLNLADKYYFQSVSDVTTSLGVVTGVPALPRTYAAFVERKF